MTYKLKDGRVSAYYGDTNVVLELDGISTGTEVQFRKNAEDTWNVTIENGEVAIPNEFFNGSYSMIIFYVTDGANTIGKGSIDIIPRTFPSDYSYEPTRIRTYEDILAEMEGMRDESKTSADSAGESASYASSSANNAEASATRASSTLTAVENIKSNVASMASSVSTSEKNVASMEESVSDMKTSVEETKALADLTETRVKEDITTLTEIENNVATMESDVESMASQVSADKTDVSNIRTEMNSVKEAVETSEKSVTASEENVKNMESSVSSMKFSVTSMASQVSADKEQVSTWVDSISGTATALSGFAETEVSFPKSDDKILILRGNEGKYITTENLTNYVKTHDINPTYAELKALVNSGNFFDVYECGQAINVDFTYNGTTYAFPFQVAHNTYRETTRPDGTTRQSVPLLATYLPPMAVQFSQYRAFLACPSGLAAGSYSVTFAQTWSKLTTLTWYFTLAHAVPAGGRLNAFRNFAEGQSDTSVRTYGADGMLMYTDTTLTSTAIDGATDLGTMNYKTRNGNFSSMQECFYGCNEYHTSAKKQFMNSDKPVNLWWTPQDEWDCAPNSLSSYGGLLSYFDPDFVDILETVKVTTAKSISLGAAMADYDTDYLRCFLPSLEEMYIVPQASTGMEGAYLQLAKDYVGKDSPNGRYSSNANTGLIRYDITNKSAELFNLRSANRDSSYYVWYVNPNGVIDYTKNTGRVLPLVYI